jgi:hypothetical protein
MLRPLPNERWNYETAAHLLNRAGFGGPPEEIQRLTALGLEGAVSALLDYEHLSGVSPDPVWAHPDPDHIEKFRQALKTAPPDEAKKLREQENRLQEMRLVE